jgi:nucleotide-binding universal stress UspA family protein
MFKSILLATDGSRHARRAAAVASSLAARFDATLTIVSVSSLSLTVDDIRRTPLFRHLSRPIKDEITRLTEVLNSVVTVGNAVYDSIPAPSSALIALADANIDSAETIARKAKVGKIRRAPLIGNAADEILDQAKKSKASLIVMGTRGLTDLGGMILGSVSHRIIHLATCACLTVK